MIKSLLMVVTWLQGGPVVQTQMLESPVQCRLVAHSAAQMIQLQARSNMNSPHNDLQLTQAGGDWNLATPIGREVARLRCADVDTGALSGAEQKTLPGGEQRLAR